MPMGQFDNAETGRLVSSSTSVRIWVPDPSSDEAAAKDERRSPEAPYRQWVLTFPWEIRFLLAMDRKFLSEMLRLFLIHDGQPGAVTFIQRLNPHFHRPP